MENQPPASAPEVSPASQDGKLSERQVLLLAFTSAVITANAYYIQPIIARVGQAFGVSETLIGFVPALNQIALALGVLLMMPLGDRADNRRLMIVFVIGQIAGLAVMAFAQDFWLLVFGSALLGFFTVGPYLLPAYVSKRVYPDQIGRTTAILTTGVIVGILLARIGSGVIAEHFGWRTVYYAAIVLMTATLVALPFMLKPEQRASSAKAREDYWSLVLSIFPLARQHPDALVSGLIQAASFGIFISVWIGIGLHVTSPEMGYGVDVVGYMAAISAINMIVTPRLGAWADRTGARRARAIVSLGQLAGVSLLLFVGHSLWLLLIPIVVMNFASPAIDVTGRMTLFSKPPEIRTRLMTAYIVLMFIGAGLASWAGATAYDVAGWTGNAVLAICLSLCVVTLSWRSLHAQRKTS